MKRTLITIILAVASSASAFAQLVPFEAKGKFGFKNEDGKEIVKAEYTNVGYFESGYTWVNKGGKTSKGLGTPISGKWGVIDSLGELVCPVQYDFVDLQNDGIVAVNVGCTIKDSLVVGGKWGLYDLKNKKEIVKPVYGAITNAIDRKVACFSNTKAEISRKIRFHKEYVSNKQTNYYIDFNIDDEELSTNLYRTSGNVTLKWGVLTIDGTEIIKSAYDKIFDYVNRAATVKSGKFLGKVGLAGNLILPCEYTEITMSDGSGVFWAAKDGKFQLYTQDGKQITEKGYPIVSDFYNGVAFACTDDSNPDKELFCLIDSTGKEITDYRFTNPSGFDLGFAMVGINDCIKIVDYAGNIIVDAEFASFPKKMNETPFNDNKHKYFYGYSKDGKVIWFREDGKLMTDNSKENFSIEDTLPNNLWNY